jgi:hypothetical protein
MPIKSTRGFDPVGSLSSLRPSNRLFTNLFSPTANLLKSRRLSSSNAQLKSPARAGLFHPSKPIGYLKLLVEVARRARDIHSAGNAALAVLYALDDARRLAALRTVGRLRRVHYLLAVTCFCYFCHRSGGSPSGVVSAHTRKMRAASTARSLAQPPNIAAQSSQRITISPNQTRSIQSTSMFPALAVHLSSSTRRGFQTSCTPQMLRAPSIKRFLLDGWESTKPNHRPAVLSPSILSFVISVNP